MMRLVLLSLALVLAGRLAAEPPAPRSPRIESCVSADALVIEGRDRNTLLDATDRATVYDAMVARYPLFARDGSMPSEILLWQRQGREWLYVTLLENPRQASEACFTATFAAPVFEALTPGLLRKYFGLGGPNADRV